MSIDPSEFLQSTRHVLLGSPEWQTLSAQLHERLQKLLANDHMTSFFSELTPAEQHAYVHKVEADMSNLPAFAPFMRTLSAVVDQRLWSRGLDIELKKEREARQDNEGVDELHGAVDYDIPFPLFSRLQNATQGGLLSLAQTQTNQLNANNANVRNGTSHSRHSSATGSAFGGSAGGKTYSATTGGSASFKTEQQRKAETDALLQAAAAEARLGGTFGPAPPSTNDLVLSTSIACFSQLLKSTPAARLKEFTNTHSLSVLHNQRIPALLRPSLYAACLQAPKAYSDFWALLRQSQLATISERDPWIVEQCERVLTEDFGDWPIGPDSETVDVDSGDGDQSEKKTHIKADAKKSDKKSDKRVHDNNSLATVKTVISYLDVCRGLETVPLEGDAIFYMTVPLLRVMQSSPEYSSAALDTVAQLIALLFALLDQELAPFSRRPQVHADFCRRLLKNLYELDYDVCRTLLRCALVPDASIPAPNQSDVDFRALVTQALQIPSAIALPPSPPSTASSNSSHIQHDLSLAPLSVCLLEVTDYLLLRCMSPAASLFVWDQLVISNMALLDQMACGALLCFRDKIVRCSSADEFRLVLRHRQTHGSGISAGGLSLRRLQDSCSVLFKTKPQMLYRMGALNQPSPIASLAAAAHPVAPSSTNSSLNSGPMSPANVAVSPAPVKRRALSINLISPEANVIPLATAKHEVSEAITKEKSERVVDFSATGTQLNFAALNAEATEDKTEAVPADGLVSLMSAIQRVFFGTVE